MTIPIVAGDFTGEAETEWTLAQMRTACDQVFETAVPDGIDLARQPNGAIMPYVIAKFATPMASSVGRSIGEHEQGQPHILTVTVFCIAADADTARKLTHKIRRLLVGQRPSATAGEYQSRGGFSFPQTESGSVPTRFEQAAYFRAYINL